MGLGLEAKELPTVKRSRLAWLGVYLRGVAMGVAELIPGVSGGTIAFITGIYLELIRSIRNLSLDTMVSMVRGRVAEGWREANLTFLVILGGGMASSIVAFSGLIAWLLENREIYVWAFFFGLIVASTLYVGRMVRPWKPTMIAAGIAGIAAGVLLVTVPPLPPSDHWLTTTLAGAIAICAWILPGVSGSFILVILGKYADLVRALSEVDIAFLSALAAGMGLGLLAFARGLVWLLRRHYRGTLAFLTGLMAGSLQKIWPWQEMVRSRIGSDGREVPVVTRPVSPSSWEAVTGGEPAVAGAVVTMVLAALIVLALEVMARRKGSD
jgi:putative membrane protein